MSSTDKTQIPITTLVLPVFIESVVRTSLLSVDQMMLYAFSEKAVAALSVVNQMAFFMQNIYLLVAMGASIHISQNLGASHKREAGLFSLASFVIVAAFSLVLSFVVVLMASSVLNLFSLEAEVHQYAWQFLVIYAAGSFFLAINVIQATVLRSYGYSRDPMLVNILALAFTISGNALCLFGYGGFPVLGVVGVAMVTVLSQVLSFGILWWRILGNKEINLPFKEILHIPQAIYLKILQVGIPTAGENISWVVGQVAISGIIASLGTNALAVYGLVITVTRYVFIFGISMSVGTQIKVGYFVGADKYNEIQQKVYRYFALTFVVSLILVILLNLFKPQILTLFTENPEIIALTSTILLVSLVLEPGRTFNLVFIPGLKGAGDVRFPVIIGVIFMWGIGVFGAYFLAIRLGLGLMGIWIALASDEWVRGIIMAFRWRSGAWKNKGVVNKI
jgi:putative MATE family efflux protein